MVRFVFDFVEKNRAAAVHLFLNSGYFQIRIDFFIRLDEIAFGFEPLQRAAQVRDEFRLTFPEPSPWQC